MTEFFENKTIVITGAGSGLGRTLAVALGKCNANIIVTDINDRAIQATVETIVIHGGKAQAQQLDVTDAHAVAALVDSLATIDIWINNAGITASGDTRDMDIVLWQQVLTINLSGVVNGSKFAFDKMATQGHGQIVNIASFYGLIPAPLSAAYAASKHGVVGLTRTLQIEGKDLGIAVTLVCPGFMQTPLFDHGTFAGVPQQEAMQLLPYKLMDVDKAAQHIIRSIQAGTVTTVFPWSARLTWWLAKISPRLFNYLANRKLQQFRALRQSLSPATEHFKGSCQ